MASSGSQSDDDATRVVFTRPARSLDQSTIIVPTPGAPAPATPGVQAPAAAGATIFVPAAASAQSDLAPEPVVGWVVITQGPGRGNFRPVHYGQNAIGRGEELRISIDYGDQRISREPHAFLVYDERERKFFVKDNGKASVVRLNGNMVLTPTPMHNRDQISIGQTTLLFIALCDETFDWLTGDAPKTA